MRWRGLIYSKIQNKLEMLKWFLDNYYAKIELEQVRVEGLKAPFIVDTKSKSCTCHRWDLIGIPYPHAIVAICAENKSVEGYCDDICLYH